MQNNMDNYIVLASDDNNIFFRENDDIKNELLNSKIFKDVFVVDIKGNAGQSFLENLKRADKEIKSKNIRISDYNLYFFNDIALLGNYVNIRKIKYHLLEDGTDCFKNNAKLFKESNENFIKKLVKKFLGLSFVMGKSRNIIDIEVNDINGCKIGNKKLIECNKQKLFYEIEEEKKKTILDIFLKEKIDFSKLSNSTLILTQPLSEDGLLKDENEKVLLYRKIIENYSKDEKVLIKPHPREKTQYEKKFKCDVIKQIFPIEIINYFPNVMFSKVITVSSTAINLIKNTKTKVFLGWEFMQNQINRREL